MKEIGNIIRENEMKSIILEWTDAGPGVGITQHAVKFRACQKVRIFNCDYLVRLHLANDDSSHNEVERVQSYVGDAIADGGAIEWEHKKLLNEFTPEQLARMPLEQFQNLELKRMQYNANKVAEEVAARIDGAAAPGGYLTGYSSENPDDIFFGDSEFLTSYTNPKSVASKDETAGSAYYSKLSDFIDSHFVIGHKFLEFKKFSCQDYAPSTCEFCKKHPLRAPQFDRPPGPVPDA